MAKIKINLGDEYKDCDVSFSSNMKVTNQFNNQIGIVENINKNDNGEIIADLSINDEFYTKMFNVPLSASSHSFGIGGQILVQHK